MKWINSWCVLAARRTVFLWLFHRVNKMFAPPTKKIWNSNVVEQLSGTILRSPCERKIEKSALLFVGCRHGVRRESNSIIIIISLQVSWYSFSGIFKLISWYDILFYYFASFFSAGRSMLFRRGRGGRREVGPPLIREILFILQCFMQSLWCDSSYERCSVTTAAFIIDWLCIYRRVGNPRQSTAVQTTKFPFSKINDGRMCMCVSSSLSSMLHRAAPAWISVPETKMEYKDM